MTHRLGSKLVLALISIVLIIAVGTIGYMLIEGWSFQESIYMTVITLTTVGYGEVHPLGTAGQIFTMVLLIVGVGIILYLLSTEAKLLLEGQLQEYIGRSRLDKKINELKDHYVICGFGRMGRTVAKEFKAKGLDTLIIDKKPMPQIDRDEFLIIEGDASNEEVLMSAGIVRAKGLVSVLPTDAENLFVVLSARELNSELFIVTRASDDRAERKIMRAGADRVVSPYHTGGIRIANTVLKPAVVDFLEFATKSGNLELQIEEVMVSENSKFADNTLGDSGIGRDLGIIIVAVRKVDGTMEFNPGSGSKIVSGDTLVAIGEVSKLKELEDLMQDA
jgi:voltage-gated potassium channel